MSKNDGGPAFPQTHQQWGKNSGPNSEPFTIVMPGMSLRDWFAGQYLANSNLNILAMTAELAYEMADKMLEARKK